MQLPFKKISLVVLLVSHLAIPNSAIGASHVFINFIFATLMQAPEGPGQQDDWLTGFNLAEQNALDLADLWKAERCPPDTRAAKLKKLDPKFRRQLCRNWRLNGGCPFGIRCRHAHKLYQLRTDP